MTIPDAIPLLNECLAHLWMIRTYLKHQEEVQDDPEMIEVPRLLYDSIRAVEPSFLKGDFETYVRRLRGKVGKLKKNAEFFAREYKRISAHTNYEMASLSYTGAVKRIEEILASLTKTSSPQSPESVISESNEAEEESNSASSEN